MKNEKNAEVSQTVDKGWVMRMLKVGNVGKLIYRGLKARHKERRPKTAIRGRKKQRKKGTRNVIASSIIEKKEKREKHPREE